MTDDDEDDEGYVDMAGYRRYSGGDESSASNRTMMIVFLVWLATVVIFLAFVLLD